MAQIPGLYAVPLPHQFNPLLKKGNFEAFELKFGSRIDVGVETLLPKFEYERIL